MNEKIVFQICHFFFDFPACSLFFSLSLSVKGPYGDKKLNKDCFSVPAV